MVRLALLAMPLILVACATPREACITGATRDQRVLERLVEQTRGNVARGYALAERQSVRPRLVPCARRLADGSRRQGFCNRRDVVTTTVPVSIDIDAERAKLRSQDARLAELRGRTDAAVRACIAANPA